MVVLGKRNMMDGLLMASDLEMEFYPESKELTHKYTYYADKTTMEEAHLFVLKANDPAYTLPIPQEVLDFNTGMPNNERPVREFSVITPNDN